MPKVDMRIIDSYNILSAEDKEADGVPNGSSVCVDKWVHNWSYRHDENNVECVDVLWERVSF